MAQTESIPGPATPAARPLPLESFLATDDPVWVWDGQGRRILWANAAAAHLWGDPRPERLKRRRTSPSSRAPARLTELARSSEFLGDHIETLHLPTPGGEVPVTCVFQRLLLAGNRPGLVVRVLPERQEKEAPAEITVHPAAATALAPVAGDAPAETKAAATTKPRKNTVSRSDRSALKAIARDLGDATGRGQSAKHAASTAKPPKKQSSKGPAKDQRATKPRTPAAAKSHRAKPAPAAAEIAAPATGDMTALLARVSHEIRNPLTIIIGFAEILKSDRMDRLPPGKAKEYASDIYRTAQLALGLADDLLGFAERASGEAPPHAWVDLNALIADCLHLLEPVANAHGVTLVRRLKRDCPMLRAHERSIRQVLLNLLMNALRHGDGGGTIRVSTRLDKQGGLVLSVKDDGPGMTPEQVAAAKAPEQAGDMKHAGRRGLGLRLVLGFVHDNRGELDIHGQPGEGTDVRIRFGPDRLRAQKPGKTSRKPQKRKRE